METFTEWLKNSHPEFSEGLLQKIHPMAGNIIGASNAAMGFLGMLGRLYTPFIGTPVPLPKNNDPPAMVSQLVPNKTSNKKIIPVTGKNAIDYVGSTIGDPLNQMWWDAGDWIPGHELDNRRRQRKGHVIPAIAKGPLETNKKMDLKAFLDKLKGDKSAT